VLVDQVNDFLVDESPQHHLNDVHGFTVCDPHALNKVAGFAKALEQLPDLGAPAMDNDRIDADEFEKDDVPRKAVLEVVIGHGVAAILDDQRLALEAADVGERFDQDVSDLVGGFVLEIGLGMHVRSLQ